MVFPYPVSHEFDALGEDEIPIVVLGVVLALFDQLPVFVAFVLFWCVAQGVHIGDNPDHLVGGEEPIGNALPQRISIERLAKIALVGDILGFRGCSGETDVSGGGEVVEDVAPCGILVGAATMALVNDDEVEEIGGGTVCRSASTPPFLSRPDKGRDRSRSSSSPRDWRSVHAFAERGEVLLNGLIHENVAVCEEEDELLGLRLPQPPNDLEGGVSLSRACRHDKENALSARCYDRDGPIDGHLLVVVRLFVRRITVVRLGDDAELLGLGEPLPLFVNGPQLFVRRKVINLPRDGLGDSGPVVDEKSVPVGAVRKTGHRASRHRQEPAVARGRFQKCSASPPERRGADSAGHRNRNRHASVHLWLRDSQSAW